MLYRAEIEIESDVEQEEFNEWLIDALRKISIKPDTTNVNQVYLVNLSEQQIDQVKEIVNQILEQRDAEKEKMYADVCAEMKIDDSDFKHDMEKIKHFAMSLPKFPVFSEIPTCDFNKLKIELPEFNFSQWELQIKACQMYVDMQIKEFQQNIEKLQQFYDKFKGEA